MLEIAVLGLLNESPMHGYEIRKRLAVLLGTFRAFSYGSLYPSLRRLAEAGWLSEESSTELPPGATRSRRGKRVYRLTAEGEEQRDGMKSALARKGERFDRYTRELHRHGLESVDREVRWLNELIEHERSDAPKATE